MFQQPAQNVAQQVSKVPEVVSNAVNTIKQNVSTSLNEFSAKTVSASNTFLTSNGIVARIAFILLVLIALIVLLKLGVKILIYFLSPAKNPYVVYGKLAGSTAAVVAQDTQEATTGIFIQRSNNQTTGIEFTWSVWLNISAAPAAGTYQHIFHRGDKTISTDPSNDYNNSPGLYIYRPSTATAAAPDNVHLIVLMSSFDSDKKVYKVDIDNVPLRKWVHVAIRMENTVMDTYINGTVTNRTVFQQTLPRQNYGNIYICQSVGSASNGFSGYLSNLRYYSRALNVFAISSIVVAGPNLTDNTTLGSASSTATNPTYLSSAWFSSHI